MTEASRNFAECVNRVRYQGASFLLQKNGTPVARLVPVECEKTDANGGLGARDDGGPSKRGIAGQTTAKSEESSVGTQHAKPAGHDALNW